MEKMPSNSNDSGAVFMDLDKLGLKKNTVTQKGVGRPDRPIEKTSSLEGLATSTAEVTKPKTDSAVFMSLKDFLKDEGK